VPLYYAPGEAYQFGWSHKVIVVSGVTILSKVAHVRRCYSPMMFVRAYLREIEPLSAIGARPSMTPGTMCLFWRANRGRCAASH